MKIINYTSRHRHIGEEYEQIFTTWGIEIEDTDPYNEKIKTRFKHINVKQAKYLSTSGLDERPVYRGDRTNEFDASTKDKQKKFIIEEVNKLLQTFKSHALIAQWSEQSAHN